MSWQYTAYVQPLLIAAAISVALALYAERQRQARGATALAILMLAVAEWSLGYALELGSAELATKVWWAQVQYLGIVTVPLAWLVLALQYTNRDEWLTPRNLALLTAVPLITLALVWTNEAHGLIWRGTGLDGGGPLLALEVTYGPWFWVHSTFSYVLLLLGTARLLLMLLRSAHLYRMQSGALLLGVLLPWLGNALYISGVNPVPYLDLTPFAFTLSGVALAGALFRFRLLDIVPVARRAVVDGMSDGVIVLDGQARIVDLNPAAQAILGSTASQAVGQPIANYLSHRLDLISRYADVLEAQEEIVLGQGEQQRCYDLRISPLYGSHGRLGGRLIVLRDITDRRRAAEVNARLFQTAVDERSRLQALVNASQDGIVLIGMDRRILLANDRALKLLRLPGQAEDWTNRLLQDALSGLRRHAAQAVQVTVAEMRRIQKGDEPPAEGEYEVAPRTIHWLNLPVMAETAPLGRLLVLRDVTQERQLDRMRNDLTHTMVHDLRNPLTTIAGWLDLLALSGDLSDDQAYILEMVRGGARKMLELVNNILDVSSLEAGQVPLKLASVSLADLIAGVLRAQAPLAAQKGLRLESHVPPSLARVWADAGLIERVLQNLIDNALKFTPTGGWVKIEVTPAEGMRTREGNGHGIGMPMLCVCVSDSGPGIPPGMQLRLFQKFAHGREPGSGSGLGLAFCKLAVEAHGGQIWAEPAGLAGGNEPGPGTVFKFTLPVGGNGRATASAGLGIRQEARMPG